MRFLEHSAHFAKGAASPGTLSRRSYFQKRIVKSLQSVIWAFRRMLRLVPGKPSAGKNPQPSRQDRWQTNWSNKSFNPPWLGRGISPEIIGAVADGWFPAGSPVLDIGCGEGDVAAWMAGRGFPATGVDIALAAVERARSLHPESPGRLEFQVMDICEDRQRDMQFRILIDRGCFHGLPEKDLRAYLATLLAISARDARLLLFVRAFREGQPIGQTEERERVTSLIRESLGSHFKFIRIAQTYLDPFNGQRPGHVLPGLVFWMERHVDKGS